MMIKLLKKNAVVLTFACGLTNQLATAQTASDLENAVTTGSQFEQAQALTDDRREQSEYTSVLEGEPGVFILKKNEIFVIGAAIGSGFTDNPGRTLDTNAENAAYGSLALSAGVNTRINGQLDAGVNVIASGTEYNRGDAPSNRNLISNVYVGTSVLDSQFYVSANATAGVNADRKFDSGTAFYGTGVNISTIRKFSKNVLIRPSLRASWQWSGQSEQDSTALTASTEVIWKPAPKWLMRANASYSYRIYDNFFEDVTFVKRKDNVIRANISVSRQISKIVDASVNIEFTDQNSSFFLSEYQAFDGGGNLKISRRF